MATSTTNLNIMVVSRPGPPFRPPDQEDMDPRQTVLITGTSSGLGLAFLRHYAALRPTPRIIALDHNALPIPERHWFAEHGSVDFYPGDVTSEAFISSLTGELADVPIHLFIHCAGIRGLVPHIVRQQPHACNGKRTDADVAAAENLDVMDHRTMMRTLEVNTWGAFHLVQCFLPNLTRAANELALLPGPDAVLPRVVILSSRMGSIASNTAGGAYAYRASKAALNALVKSFSVDVPQVIFSLLHPGRVETGLVQWKEEGAMSVEESLRDCLKVIDGLEEEDSGKLVDRFGVEIPW